VCGHSRAVNWLARPTHLEGGCFPKVPPWRSPLMATPLLSADLANGAAIVHRDLIIALADRHRLPAIYFARYFVTGGGLISYGTDSIEPHRRAAVYVDRILKGEKPGDLPVEASTKYELVINMKTARSLGLEIPTTVLARADEVIE